MAFVTFVTIKRHFKDTLQNYELICVLLQ